MMNIIKIIKVVIVLMLLYSCEFFDVDYDTYTLRNESDYKVSICAYSHFSVDQSQYELIDSIVLLPNEQYDTIKDTGENEGTTGYFIAQPDSVVFVFNEQRIKVYTCSTPYEEAKEFYSSCQEDGNIILYMGTPNTYDDKRKGYDYVYTITNEDYENAMIY